MRQISLADQLSLTKRVATWAVCFQIQNTVGDYFRSSDHDEEIVVERTVNDVVLDGVYQPFSSIQTSEVVQTSDLSVSNLDVEILLASSGITVADIRAGLFDNVACTIFLVNWADPTDSGIILQHGMVGNFQTFVNDLAKGELRGMTQKLAQQLLPAVSLTCRVKRLGQAPCSVDVASLTVTGMVDTVTSRRVLETTLDLGATPSAPGHFVGGLLTFTSGTNSGFAREVKLDSSGDPLVLGRIELFEPFPYPVAPGDAFSLEPGCDRRWETCRDRFGAQLDFDGEPDVPGPTEMLRGVD
jgi:uncharacterized phage protein (TIGR02218 family)